MTAARTVMNVEETWQAAELSLSLHGGRLFAKRRVLVAMGCVRALRRGIVSRIVREPTPVAGDVPSRGPVQREGARRQTLVYAEESGR